jgi:hypothetical protein
MSTTEKKASPPTHNLVITLVKGDTKVHTQAGCAWVDAEGRAIIKLNPGIVLDWRDNVYLSLYPRKERDGYPF